MPDLLSLKDLPLPLAAFIICFYLLNQNNAAYAKQLVGLIAEFTSKYEALLETVQEDRKNSSERWLERDRLLNERLEKNTEAVVRNANETHQLRNMVQPLVLSVEADRRRSRGGSQSQGRTGGGDTNATG